MIADSNNIHYHKSYFPLAVEKIINEPDRITVNYTKKKEKEKLHICTYDHGINSKCESLNSWVATFWH